MADHDYCSVDRHRYVYHDLASQLFNVETNLQTSQEKADDMLTLVESGDAKALLRYLLDNLANEDVVNSRDEETGNTALMIAVTACNVDVMNVLLDHHADVTLRNKRNITVMDLTNDEDIFKLLVGRTNTQRHKYDLKLAAWTGNLDFVKLICTSNDTSLVDPNIKNGDGCPVLCLAVRDMAVFEKHFMKNPKDYVPIEVIRLLLNCGADITTVDDDGSTALHLAAKQGGFNALRAVKLLLEWKPSLETRNVFSHSALHCACISGQLSNMTELLIAGADPNGCDNKGMMSLHLLAFHGHEDGVDTLFNYGCDGDMRDNDGHKPSEIAATSSIADRIKEALTVIKTSKTISMVSRDKNSTAFCKDKNATKVPTTTTTTCLKHSVSLSSIESPCVLSPLTSNIPVPLNMKTFSGNQNQNSLACSYGDSFGNSSSEVEGKENQSRSRSLNASGTFESVTDETSPYHSHSCNRDALRECTEDSSRSVDKILLPISTKKKKLKKRVPISSMTIATSTMTFNGQPKQLISLKDIKSDEVKRKKRIATTKKKRIRKEKKSNSVLPLSPVLMRSLKVKTPVSPKMGVSLISKNGSSGRLKGTTHTTSSATLRPPQLERLVLSDTDNSLSGRLSPFSLSSRSPSTAASTSSLSYHQDILSPSHSPKNYRKEIVIEETDNTASIAKTSHQYVQGTSFSDISQTPSQQLAERQLPEPHFISGKVVLNNDAVSVLELPRAQAPLAPLYDRMALHDVSLNSSPQPEASGIYHAVNVKESNDGTCNNNRHEYLKKCTNNGDEEEETHTGNSKSMASGADYGSDSRRWSLRRQPTPMSCIKLLHELSPQSSVNSVLSNSPSEKKMPEIQYERGDLLGCGAYGKVFCGLNSLTGELIAVKQITLLNNDIAPLSKEMWQRQHANLEREVDILKKLSHKNIIQYLGVDWDDETVTLSIIMEYVSGGSISSLLQRFGAFENGIIKHYTRQIVEAVCYLHENNIIHRDVKGANILVDSNGIIKLIDFGSAKQFCNTTETDLASVQGTPYWMSPEVVTDSGYGLKSDIWSIGCTMYEMATAKPPYVHFGPVTAIFHIGIGSEMPRLPDSFPSDAHNFISACLERTPDKRSTAAELLKHPYIYSIGHNL